MKSRNGTGPSLARIEELRAANYSVYQIFDGDPPRFAWNNSESKASQSGVKDRQPFRLSAQQAWDDCDAHYSASVPSVANPDWLEPVEKGHGA